MREMRWEGWLGSRYPAGHGRGQYLLQMRSMLHHIAYPVASVGV